MKATIRHHGAYQDYALKPLLEDPAERSGLRLFYREWRPTRVGKIVSWALAWLSGLRLTPPLLIKLQVKGRSSGRLRTTALVSATHQGQRYLVSMLGDGSEWVRNVRAAGGEAFIKRGRSRRVMLTEVPPRDRAPILKVWCQVATSGRQHLPVPHDAPVAAFETIAKELSRLSHRPDPVAVPQFDPSDVFIFGVTKGRCKGCTPLTLERLRSAEVQRYEQLHVVALNEQRDVLAGAGSQLLQLLGAAHRRPVQCDDDVSGLDAGLRCRSSRVLNQ